MAGQGGDIEFQHLGIGLAISRNRLEVPVNQREYNWERGHVETFLQDVVGAMNAGKATYFLGTVVLTHGKEEALQVADGQQRLATTVITLAAIRDYFAAQNEPIRAKVIEDEYLFTTDIRSTNTIAKLHLNVDDHEFFEGAVLRPPGHPGRKARPKLNSNKLLQGAADTTSEFIGKLISTKTKEQATDALLELVGFLRDRTKIVLLTAAIDEDAFVIFETLNDRGLKASQADLIKNHLVRQAKKRDKEAQQHWARMIGILEQVDADLVVSFLRHSYIGRRGPTKTDELLSVVKSDATTEARALALLMDSATQASIYAATFNQSHVFWNGFTITTKANVETLNMLRVEQIRPLELAVMLKFERAEIEKCFRMFVSWTVRFLIAGGAASGSLEKGYADRARDVGNGTITNAKGLWQAMKAVVPYDAAFEAAFRIARVTKGYLATYYLNHLEEAVRGFDTDDVPNRKTLNLDHVMPESPEQYWAHISKDEVQAYTTRLGNLALVNAEKNVKMANLPFSKKRPHFKATPIRLSQIIADESEWGAKQIIARQDYMAGFAVRAWPANPT